MFGFWIRKFLKNNAESLALLDAPPVKSGSAQLRDPGFPFSPSDKLEKDVNRGSW